MKMPPDQETALPTLWIITRYLITIIEFTLLLKMVDFTNILPVAYTLY